MKVLLAPTEDFIKRERSSTAEDTLLGDSVSVPIQNSDNFLANDFVVLGWEGSEQAELAQIVEVVGNSIVIDTLRLAHSSGEPIRKYRYNKRKFYGGATATGMFSELTSQGSPILIQVDDPQGTFLEYAGGEGYLYFKSTYWNSYTSEESNIADANTVLADESLRYCSLYAIRKQAGLTENPFITDGTIETYRKRAENEVNSYLYSRYILPLQNSLGNTEIPFLLENCTTLLAAGYADYQEFGVSGEGVKWLGEARAVLKAVQVGTQRLIDSTYVEFTQKTLTQGVTSYPDTIDDINGPAQYFAMGQRF